MEQEAHSVEFQPSGRGKAQCPPNPNFPNGVKVDVSDGLIACIKHLPYPAPECGAWIVRCKACDMSVAVTAAGRHDDPVSVTMACKLQRTKGLDNT